MSTMKSLSIGILEYVLSQPAHKLPAVFDLEQCPFPYGELSLEEILEEIIRLKSIGLIEANVLKGIDNKPYKVQVRYVTLDGRNYLEGKNPLAEQRSFLIKILGGTLAVAALIGFLILGGNQLGGLLHRHGTVEAAADSTPIPTPTPMATPAPTPEPTPTPTPEPMPSPSPSPKHRAKSYRTPAAN
ncbi:MAG: hypothetical protein ORN23_09675 [Chthoniobacterales bacterium]|nr:hypothetical protein [Chthoniobacterales bacterium]